MARARHHAVIGRFNLSRAFFGWVFSKRIVVAQRSSHLGERDEAWKPPRHEFSSVACCEPVVGDRPAILHLPMPTVVHGAPGKGSNPKSAFGTLK